MHLDCVFSILGDDMCLMLKEMMGTSSPTRRLVDEYVQDPVSNSWHLEREKVEFSAYMRDNGFHIVEIAGPDQLVSLPAVLGQGQECLLQSLPGAAPVHLRRLARWQALPDSVPAQPAQLMSCQAAGECELCAAIRLQRAQPWGQQDHQRPLRHSAPDRAGPQLQGRRADRGLLQHHQHVWRRAL